MDKVLFLILMLIVGDSFAALPKSFTFELVNDQNRVKINQTPVIQLLEGKHSECFAKINAGDKGYFGASGDNITGSLQLPWRRQRNLEETLVIFWRFNEMERKISAKISTSFFDLINSLQLVVGQTNSGNFEVNLGNGFFLHFYLNSGSNIVAKARIYYQKRLTNGVYNIKSWDNSLFVGHWWKGSGNGYNRVPAQVIEDTTQLSRQDLWQYWQITRYYDDFYLIYPKDNSALGQRPLTHELNNSTHGIITNDVDLSSEPRFLWRITCDHLDRWTIRTGVGSLAWTSYDTSTAGYEVVLRDEILASNTQRFRIVGPLSI